MNEFDSSAASPAGSKHDWRYWLGLVLIGYSALPLLSLALLPFLGLPLAQSGTFAVAFLATGELAFVGAVVLLGKPFIEGIKSSVLGFFKHVYRPPVIGRGRHRLGVGLLIMSFVPYYIVLLDEVLLGRDDHALVTWSMIGGEVLFYVAMLVLGGPFWDRLQQLFVYPADAPQPPVR